MRNTTVAIALAGLLMTGSVGCKTASKLAWWKTADNSSVESTALAHSGPALPADIVKQAEVLASTESPAIKIDGGSSSRSATTDPFASTATAATAATTQQGSGAKLAAIGSKPSGSSSKPADSSAYASTGYPSTATPVASSLATGASPYPTTSAPALAATPTAPAAVAAATTSPGDSLGSVDLPYNPSAVPPVRNVTTAQPAVSSTSSDRYASASTSTDSGSRYGGSGSTPALGVSAPLASVTNDRYANIQVPSAPPVSSSNLGTPVSAGLNQSVASTNAPALGSRYSNTGSVGRYASQTPASTSAYTTPGNIAAATPITPTPTNSTTPVVASAVPYRPGGTSTYPGTAAAVEVATRPASPAGVSGESVPSTAPAPVSVPRYR